MSYPRTKHFVPNQLKILCHKTNSVSFFSFFYSFLPFIFRDPTLLDELDLDEKTKSTLLSNIMRRLTPQPVKIRADIEVSCYAYDGIDAVKNSLLEGLQCSSEDVPVKVGILYLVK